MLCSELHVGFGVFRAKLNRALILGRGGGVVSHSGVEITESNSRVSHLRLAFEAAVQVLDRLANEPGLLVGSGGVVVRGPVVGFERERMLESLNGVREIA